ncbi:uncharacterized protein BO96DRAFT_405507 [Aspergillus niger CBS 101883]|uniref:Uncharacterized protein n=3 Tax=Aspergillus niger TaxID=5061 RepID=A2QZL1_ASPNC|nr:uncharacterized protein BO96DRAFT_405507 [Aspergillus niger CBS 101883]XP_059604464.1 hypothetical protein An12g05300 [Aspergillus niger]PYH50697.1 hypothetical protein BO96DRAFT_405507 [Aspergillus niger CBS 101883]RDH17064.1 hypothetical protein M747DRAFT_356959 [Aspergillus niger ATCC 13496]CAK46243.1 hypothetical protein An12g05300 [Aspergillus niger]
MGGILVKDALAIGYQSNDVYAVIPTMTYGIFSWRSSLWIVALVVGADCCYDFPFEPLLKMYRFFTICETMDEVVEGINIGLIVDSDSAILKECPRQQVEYWPNRTHRTLCKFASTDPEWQLISEMLVDAANHSANCISYSPLSSKWGEITQSHLWNSQESSPIPLSEAIVKAQACHNIIAQDSQRDGQPYRRQEEINRLNGDVSTSVQWLWPIVLRILGLDAFALIWLVSFFLPRRETVVENAEKAQANERRVMELEQEIIISLHEDQSRLLHKINVLEIVLADSTPESNAGTSADELVVGRRLLRNLHLDVGQTILGIRQHNRSYLEAERRVNLIEDSRRVTAGRNDTEFWVAIGERAQEEERRLQKRTENGVTQEDSCGKGTEVSILNKYVMRINPHSSTDYLAAAHIIETH